MALWNAPTPVEHHAWHACRAAVKIQLALDKMNQDRLARSLPVFITRIGIHSGAAVVGNVGTPDRLSYTVIGDAVNVAARLEALNKDIDSAILVSSQTHAQIDLQFECGSFTSCGSFALKGRSEPIEVFRLEPNRV